MGKKNRRKKVNKKERKEQLEERRERLPEIVDHEDDDPEYNDDGENDDEKENLSIEVGNRVFYADDGVKRGVVKDISASEGRYYLVLPVQEADDSASYVGLPESVVMIRDDKEWTTRFKTGDRVVFRDFKSRWVAGSVTALFPGSRDRPFVFTYTCMQDGICYSDYGLMFDTDKFVMKHPQSFRFAVGDDVVFASSLAAGVVSSRLNEAWIRGKITSVDIVGLSDYYAVYECSYVDRKRMRICHVLKDNDEHVASVTSRPRERLFEAIEQDCSYKHIDFLAKSSELDVMAFRDLFLSKAIENASYGALLWLQENAQEDLAKICDNQGNRLLHQIAKSPHAERFFDAAAARDWNAKYSEFEPYINLSTNAFYDYESSLFRERNGQGRTFLHELIASKNSRALDLILSPNRGLAWRIALDRSSEPFLNGHLMTRDKNGLNLKDTARLIGQFEMEKMIDEFSEWHLLYELSFWLENVCEESRDSSEDLPNEIMSKFGEGETPLSIGKRLIYFRKRWEHRAPQYMRPSLSMEFALVRLSRFGQYDALSWLLEADSSLDETTHQLWVGPPNPGEFTQHYKETEAVNGEKELNLVGFASVGGSFVHGTYDEDDEDDVRDNYISILRGYDIREGISLVGYMKCKVESSDSYMLEYLLEDRIRLLEDDKSLQGRLKILDYLVKEKGMSPPDLLSVIKWRQCGILRWLLENDFIKMEESACENTSIMREGSGLTFLDGESIPQNMTVGTFLCFAAIEFDDLQSFEWLVENRGVPLPSLVYNGLNALHCCASLGRAEIVLWLLQSQPQSTLTSLLEEKCSRPPWNGHYSAHIAVEEGFTFVSDTLLSSVCPKETDSGKTVVDLAMNSSFEYVRKWGVEKEKPLQLEKDIQGLLHVLSIKESSIGRIKKHLVKSQCMNPRRWNDCGYATANSPGSLGKSYAEILKLCFRFDDPDDAVWLCQELAPSEDARYFWSDSDYDSVSAPGKLDSVALLQFARDANDKLLCDAFTTSWAKNIDCPVPALRNPVLSMMLQHVPAESSATCALESVRGDTLRIDALGTVLDEALLEIDRLFAQGAKGTQINEVLGLISRLAADLGCKADAFFSHRIVTANGKLDLEGHLSSCNYREDRNVYGMIALYGEHSMNLPRLYVVLAVEGHAELIEWLQSEKKCVWTEKQVIAAVRMAAYMGHTDVVDYFLRRQPDEGLVSEKSDRLKAAALGAVEAGKVADAKTYLEECRVNVFISEKFSSPIVPEAFVLKKNTLASSLEGTMVFGCLHHSDGRPVERVSNSKISEERLELLDWMVSKGYAESKALLESVALYTAFVRHVGNIPVFSYERCFGLIDFVNNDTSCDIFQHQEQVNYITEDILTFAHMKFLDVNAEQDRLLSLVAKWLQYTSLQGVDIQQLKCQKYGASELTTLLALNQTGQLQTWSQFDPIKEGGSLEEIKHLVETGNLDLNVRCHSAFLPTHLAAAYNRVDLLKWLVQDKYMSLDEFDGHGRDVLQVAKDSDARSVSEWIVLNASGNEIAVFASSHFRRRRALREKKALLLCVRRIQAWQRGNNVRRACRGRLLSRLDEMQRFQEIWGGSVTTLSSCLSLVSECSWKAIKQREHDIMRAEDCVEDEDMLVADDTEHKLQEAAARVLADISVNCEHAPDVSCSPNQPTRHDSNHVGGNDSPQAVKLTPDSKETNYRRFTKIKMTQDVVRWLRRGDSKYRDFFIGRIRQLAAGDRSRILAKRLTGSKTLIYETYLEQKSGHRILWTESEGDSLLIWYVAKHKSVSRLMTLIDDAENRSSRQLTAASSLPEISGRVDSTSAGDNMDGDRIILDPLGDTPLKLFEVKSDEVVRLSDPTWKPRLYLTTREREVVETCGTVLLLGRSGTGKTCVIGNRMDYDRQCAGNDLLFSQLFVARSKGLCDYVKEAVNGDGEANLNFETFNEVVSSLEENLPPIGDGKNAMFLPSSKMDFQRFKKDFYRSDRSSDTVDALIIWTNIRSFIKGSIEALQCSDKVLSEEKYLNLGKKRCRLSMGQRKFVYSTFQRYKTFLMEVGLWDDCDRITALVQRLDHARKTDLSEYQEVRRNKIYVDEVQDYTQAEIALFFYLSGPGDLFLAGDPAQSVVEGVEFRFEEIRSVGYHLCGEDHRHLIPDKPKTVHVNFRSHCGILNVAAAILSCLFEAFPDSAKQLKEDRGLFQGPRPGVFHRVEVPRLAELVSKRNGIVVLTHDRNIMKWKRSLGDYPLVYGIREAKGLEFQEVILVDFFRDIPASLQKVWRDLLLGRDVSDIACRPEIEGHLKLLYTAATRCIQRLYFAETASSLAGDAFVRWLTTTTTTRSTDGAKGKEALAVKSNVESVEKMTRTPDEWRSAGLDNAVMAESADELSEKETWLDRALYCFEQVGDTELASRARAHRLCIQFQLAFDNSETNDKDATESELQAALLTEQLLKEHLFLEAREICDAILPMLGERAQETLQDRLISRLPSGDTD